MDPLRFPLCIPELEAWRFPKQFDGIALRALGQIPFQMACEGQTANLDSLSLSLCFSLHMSTHTNIYIYIYIHTYLYMYSIYIYIYIYMCVYIYNIRTLGRQQNCQLAIHMILGRVSESLNGMKVPNHDEYKTLEDMGAPSHKKIQYWRHGYSKPR